MSRVHLKGIFINDAEHPDDWLALYKGSSFQPATATAGVTQQTAGGRVRGIIQGPQLSAWTLTAENLTYVKCEWLRRHEGRFVWVRDWQGRRVHGWWLATPIDVHDGNSARVTLAITETSPEP